MSTTATHLHTILESPLGALLVTGHVPEHPSAGQSAVVTGLFFRDHNHQPSLDAESQEEASGFDDLRQQLGEYFDDGRTEFDLPLKFCGTDFQRSVWNCLREIPFGVTVTYKSIAGKLNRPNAVRAVGAAVGRNPISIIVPCHRVLATSGALTGFAGGVERKRFLLNHEAGSADRPLLDAAFGDL